MPDFKDSAPLWSRFFPDDPYNGFDADGWSSDLQGWGSRDPIFAHLVKTVEPRLIIEVGTWKGASAIQMASVADQLDHEVGIVCVDTWLGNPAHFLRRDNPAYWESLRIKHGYPRLYEQFLANVVHSGYAGMIVPLPQTSENAAEILKALGIKADLIYIDAAHGYQAVLDDLYRYGRLLTKAGVMFGDDFKSKPVADAARDYANDRNLELLTTPNKFAIPGVARADLPWPP